MAAPGKEIFWLHFCIAAGSGDASSIFIYSLWSIQDVFRHTVQGRSMLKAEHKITVVPCIKQKKIDLKHKNLLWIAVMRV